MDNCRLLRSLSPPPKPKLATGRPPIHASDALPLPIRVTNCCFAGLFVVSVVFLMRQCRFKVLSGVPLHAVDLADLAAVLSFVSSLTYLLNFFPIPFVQPFLSTSPDDAPSPSPAEKMVAFSPPNDAPVKKMVAFSLPNDTPLKKTTPLLLENDEEIVDSVVSGSTASHILESKLGDCRRAAGIRRQALERITGRQMGGLPIDGFDYESILGRCCELPVGFVTLPVGIAGPLVLDGRKHFVPMATTEGCLVASTNRGCKAIAESGGASSVVLRDGMTRAPAVRFATARRAVELKFFLEDAGNFETLALVFNRSSRFARLLGIQCSLAGRNVYVRFSCSTGDAMGMNMVSKGVQNVLDFLQDDFPDMDVISISGNFCSDKKPAAVNWIEGRGKSVVCEAIIEEEVVHKVLKTSVLNLVELNTIKNLAGSAVAGALGGFNAHASNIVTAIFIATGQDPAQNVESSNCITMMEAINDGKDLHISVTMPSIEVGTVGGGTQLASQSACLDLLGVKGANMQSPGANAKLLATIVAGAVLAGELSLMSALAAGQLVKSHMKYNRANRAEDKAATMEINPKP